MAKKKTDTPAPATEPVTPKVVKRAPRTTPATTAKAASESAPKKTRATAARPKTPTAPEPTFEEIARVAYEIHLERGGHHGLHFEDWLEAERKLRSGQ